MSTPAPHDHERQRSEALTLLASERPRNLGWLGAGGLLYGDWGTSRLYVLGLAFLVSGRSSFALICMMSFLILAVAWAYTQICRLYPEGGGVYSAARNRHPLLGVLAALLLFADYTVTASLSALEAWHYFGLQSTHALVSDGPTVDAGHEIILHDERDKSQDAAAKKHAASVPFYQMSAFWACVSIAAIGDINLLGPRHSAGIALVIAGAMILLTGGIIAFAFPQIDWSTMPSKMGGFSFEFDTWRAFVGSVLALSGVEAIASLTGVMKKPVSKTASKSIWICAIEVALFNILLALVMLSIMPLDRHEHTSDMLAYMAQVYMNPIIGPAGEWTVRILAGVLLLSAANTAIGALMGLLYVMSRDKEMPQIFQKLNGYGTPWVAAIVATSVPVLVLLFVNETEGLSHLYAIGIVGAVAINCVLCAFHPRLRKFWRKGPMLTLGIFLTLIWITLAVYKHEATIFVGIVMLLGFGLRYATRYFQARRPKPSLLRQAIMDQLTPDALAKPRMLLATAGGAQLAEVACEEAKRLDQTLVVAFVREVALNYKVEGATRMTIDTDPAAQALFIDFLDKGHAMGVPIIPAYDTGLNSAEMLAELAAMNNVSRVVIGTSRRGALHQIIKGSFQRKLESLLPSEMPVEVIAPK